MSSSTWGASVDEPAECFELDCAWPLPSIVMSAAPPPPHHPVGDQTARQRYILSTAWFTVPGALAAVAAGYAIVPPLRGLDDPGARVILALRWLPVAMIPYVAVCLTIAAVRLSEGSHDPLAGAESTRLEIHRRVMANTLEQFVWFAVSALALAALLGPASARVVPVTCVVFAIVRLLYWRGYFSAGTLGRAPAVQLTMSLNVAMLLASLALLARSLFAT